MRLSPEARQALGQLEQRWGLTRSGAVERVLLEATDGLASRDGAR